MEYFIKKLIDNAKKYPDRQALVSYDKKVFTYADLDYYSAKVYAFLKEKGIGKESFVMICLPHSVAAVISMIGVWKTGAAFTITENNRASERIEFIKKDCNCNIVIDETVWAQMLKCEPLAGFEETDKNDACYAIYTSGTTGKPKGIIHEYGKLEQMIEASDATMSECANDDSTHFALVTPLDFAATVTEVVPRLYRTHCIYIASSESIRNPAEFEKFFLENKITDTAMSASLLKTYTNISPYLKTILCTGEASNGLKIDGVRLINKYAMSESLFTVAAFGIDRLYDVTPAGKKCLDEIDIMILDDNGNLLQNGETGEICFKNEYFRGYLNLPEQTSKAMSGGLFHSGDMGFIDENGNLVVSGRKDDMIKINGNRIEPAEIEAVVKSVLGIETAVAKGFSNNERSYIALYYLNSEAKEIFANTDLQELRNKLSKHLPYYMIPTYYVGIDKLPLNANGKLSKKLLPEPDVNEMRSYFEAPKNPNEKFICEKMEEILDISGIGRKDDFFLLGGDSLRTITLVTACRDFGLTSSDVYKLRTPEKIAKFFASNTEKNGGYSEELNRLAMQREQELLPDQIDIVDQQFFAPDTDMWNIPVLMKIKKGIDCERLRKAAMRAFSHHPSFGTKIKVKEDGAFVQYYDPSCYTEIPIIETTDAEFSVTLKGKNLVRPFTLCNSPLYRAEFYKTESSMYFFLEVHHLICDGTSLTILLDHIYQCYMDENCILPPDFYYLYLQNYSDIQRNRLYEDAKSNYDEFYSKYPNIDSCHGVLKQDFLNIDFPAGDVGCILDVPKSPEHGNVFFITATAIAMSKFNNENLVLLRWTYNNRDTAQKFDMTGLIYRNLPIVLKIDETSAPETLLFDVKKQVDFSIQNCKYPYVHKHFYQFNDSPIAIYQLNTGAFGNLLDLLEEGELLFHKLEFSDVMCVVDIFEDVNSPKLTLGLHYSAGNYSSASMERFCKLFNDATHYLDGSSKGQENHKND